MNFFILANHPSIFYLHSIVDAIIVIRMQPSS